MKVGTVIEPSSLTLSVLVSSVDRTLGMVGTVMEFSSEVGRVGTTTEPSSEGSCQS